MNAFETWFILRVFKRMLKQGPEHHSNVELLYRLIRGVWEEEFTEDNSATHDAMLREAFERTQYRSNI